MTILLPTDFQQVLGGTLQSRPLNRSVASGFAIASNMNSTSATGLVGFSTDGKVFSTASTPPNATRWVNNGIAAFGNYYLLGNTPPNNGELFLTADGGDNWSSLLTFAAGTFAMAANSTVAVGVNLTSLTFSLDGTIWTEELWTANHSSAFEIAWEKCTWINELSLFVAAGRFVSFGTSQANMEIMTSPDGQNWTLRVDDSISETNRYTGLAFAANQSRVVATGRAGLQRQANSTDAITWSSGAIASQAWTDLAYSTSLGRLLATRANITMSFSDNGGNTWADTTYSPGGNANVVNYSKTFDLFYIPDIITDLPFFSSTGLAGSWTQCTMNGAIGTPVGASLMGISGDNQTG